MEHRLCPDCNEPLFVGLNTPFLAEDGQTGRLEEDQAEGEVSQEGSPVDGGGEARAGAGGAAEEEVVRGPRHRAGDGAAGAGADCGVAAGRVSVADTAVLQ